jgi:hypothetical protein
MDRVPRHVHAWDIIAVGHRCFGDVEVDLPEELTGSSTVREEDCGASKKGLVAPDVGGIQNQAFRIPKIKECFQLPEFLCERPSGETRGVLESIFISQNLSFDQYPLSPVEPPNKLRITRGVRVSVRLFGFPTTKPQRRILLTQLVLAWDSLGGFRRP